MTRQAAHIAAQKKGTNWCATYTSPDNSGTGASNLYVLDENENQLLVLNLCEHLEGCSRFADWGTAGLDWNSQVLAYTTRRGRYDLFVLRPWWGARLVVSLNDLSMREFAVDEPHFIEFERKLVLERLVALVEDHGESSASDDSPSAVDCRQDSALHWAGMIELYESVPLLLKLEEMLGGSYALL